MSIWEEVSCFVKPRTINWLFLGHCLTRFHERVFTNVEAYDLYVRQHRRTVGYTGWTRMQVRNTLCTAAQHGLLRRLGPGVYTFSHTRPVGELVGEIRMLLSVCDSDEGRLCDDKGCK